MIDKNVLQSAFVVISLFSASAFGQWLNYPTPGIPRTADGTPNLSAPAPRTADGKPDLSGLWRPGPNARAEIAKTWGSIRTQPWAQAIADGRRDDFGKDNPLVLCLPVGPAIDFPFRKVIQTPEMVVLLNEDFTYRQVFMDGRELGSDPNPTWMGYSVGRWDKDTLVIESNGFNGRSWIGAGSSGGFPHSEALLMTERLRRIDFGHMDLQRTLTDPTALIEPLTVTLPLELDADTELLEYVCNENERDHSHIVGKVSDFAKNEVAVAPAILAGYAGTYAGKMAGSRFAFKVSVGVNGALVLDGFGGFTQRLFAVSQTRFVTSFGYIEFIKDAEGAVSQLVVSLAEDDFKLDRQ